MGGGTGHSDSSVESKIIYTGAAVIAGGGTALGLREHFLHKNAAYHLGQIHEKYETYSALPDDTTPDAARLRTELMRNVMPPYTTSAQDITIGTAGLGVSAAILAWGFRKSIMRFLSNSNDTTKNPTSKPRNGNGPSL